MKLSQFKTLIREEVKKVLNEASVSYKIMTKPGTFIDDYDLLEKNLIKPKHQDAWMELFSDEPDLTPGTNKRLTKLANSFLEENGYTWRIEKAISQNDDGEITLIFG